MAQLMQPEVRRYQSIIWPDRSIGKAGQEYKTEQLQAYTMQQVIGEYAVTVYAGTQGISLAVSDSYSYHRIENGATYELSDAFYGLSVPLVERGIPLGAVSLDHLEDASDLEGVEVLLLTYDVMKPMSEQANQAIADWVRSGGVALYLGGSNGIMWTANGGPTRARPPMKTWCAVLVWSLRHARWESSATSLGAGRQALVTAFVTWLSLMT